MSRSQTKAELQELIGLLRAQLEEAREGKPPTYFRLREQIRSLTSANVCVREMAESSSKEVTRLQFRVDGLKRDLDEARTASGIKKPHYFSDENLNIDPDMLNRLIRLAHPDRHAGSEGSKTATQWLLEQRSGRK